MKRQAALACICWFLGSTLQLVHSGAILRDLGMEDQIRSYIEDSFRDAKNIKVETGNTEFAENGYPEYLDLEPKCPPPDCHGQCDSPMVLIAMPSRPECLMCVCQEDDVVDPLITERPEDVGVEFADNGYPEYLDPEPECPPPDCHGQCDSPMVLIAMPSRPECLMCVCQEDDGVDPLITERPEDVGVEFGENGYPEYLDPEPECPPPVCPETCEYDYEFNKELIHDPTNPDCLLCVCAGKKESPLLQLDR